MMKAVQVPAPGGKLELVDKDIPLPLENLTLEDAPEAYNKMMNSKIHFRAVIKFSWEKRDEFALG